MTQQPADPVTTPSTVPVTADPVTTRSTDQDDVLPRLLPADVIGDAVPPGASGTHAASREASPVLSPSNADPVVRAASEVVGGPAGRRAAAGPWLFRAVPVLVLLATTVLGLGLVQKEHCRAQGWSTPDMFWHACYSDVAVLYGSSGLGSHDRPGLGEAVTTLGQPPLASAAIWAASALVPDTGHSSPRRFFDLSALLLAASLCVTVTATAIAAGRRRWDAAHVALSPLLVTVGLVSYSLLALMFVALCLLAWSRRRAVLAGALLGLAILTAPTLAVVLVAVLALAVRERRTAPALSFAASAGVVWLGLRLLLVPGLTGGLSAGWRTWKEAGPGYGSLWLVPQLLASSRPRTARLWYTGGALSSSVTTALVLSSLAVVAVAVVALAVVPTQRPRLAHVALFAVATTLIVSKSLPPQASLVLLPFIALAGLPWRDHLLWAVPELAYFVGVWLYIAAGSDPNRGLTAAFYMVLLLLRLAGIGWLGAQAVRMARDPVLDPVRVPEDGQPGADDPISGPLVSEPAPLVVALRA